MIKDMTSKQFQTEIHMAMDGVVLTIPPKDTVDRENYVWTDERYCWRKPSERDLPELFAHDAYKKQVLDRVMFELHVAVTHSVHISCCTCSVPGLGMLGMF